MDITSPKDIVFHFNTLPKQTKQALDFLSNQAWLGESHWYLAGGTALALHTGNRKSVDLDFFTADAHFESTDILNHFTDNPDWETDINKKDTIYGLLLGAKISFIAYPFFIPKQEYVQYGSLHIIQPRDVAVMKVIDISQRGKKRDFFDLYWCAKNIEPLEDIIKRLPEQYPSVAHDYNHILKSMVYFEDAEADPEPEIYFDADWDTVKKFFRQEVPVISMKVMGLNK